MTDHDKRLPDVLNYLDEARVNRPVQPGSARPATTLAGGTFSVSYRAAHSPLVAMPDRPARLTPNVRLNTSGTVPGSAGSHGTKSAGAVPGQGASETRVGYALPPSRLKAATRRYAVAYGQP